MRTSNALDAVLEEQNNKTYLTFKTIGGIIDFRFILGETSPEILIEKFHIFLGRSAIPPFWSLGHHQCKYGYSSSK